MNDMAQDLARLAPEGAETARGWPAAAPEPAPAVLGNLRAAGLASHAARGDASAAGGETGALRALCGLVAGPVYRLDPFHYAFCLRPGDLGGGLGDLAPEHWAGALEEALRRAGAGLAVRALAPPPEAAAGGLAAEAPVWLMRAWDAAVAAGVQAAGPGVQAVINAHFAAATARLTAALVTADRPAAADPAEAAPAGTAADAPQAVGETVPEAAGEISAQAAPEAARAEAEAEAGAPAEAVPCASGQEGAPGNGAERGPEVAALERRLAVLEARLQG